MRRLVSALRPGIMTVFVNGEAQRMVVLGGFAEVSADGKLTVLADLANSVEEFDRGVLAERIAAQEEKIKAAEPGSAARPGDRAARSLPAGRQSPARHGVELKRDDFSLNRHLALGLWWSMIFSENRYTLFGIML